MKKALFFIPAIVLLIVSGCREEESEADRPTPEKVGVLNIEENDSESPINASYVKPIGWTTYTNWNYGYSVDVPAEWTNELEAVEGSDLFFKYGNSLDQLTMSFIVRDEVNNGNLPKIQANEQSVQRGGDVFKYFKVVYAPESNHRYLTSLFRYGINHDPNSESFIIIGKGSATDTLGDVTLMQIETVLQSFRFESK